MAFEKTNSLHGEVAGGGSVWDALIGERKFTYLISCLPHDKQLLFLYLFTPDS